jgi:hypothetical protein
MGAATTATTTTTMVSPGESSSVGRSGTAFFDRRRQTSVSGGANDSNGDAEEELVDSALVQQQGTSKNSDSTTLPPTTTTTSTMIPEVGFINRTPSRSSSSAGGGKEGGGGESAKPVWLKGLFSVSTTTTKPVSTLRSDLIKVLDRLGVQHRDVKNGFECVHVPSIDLSSFGASSSKEKENNKNVKSTIKRRASKLLLSKKDLVGEEGGEGTGLEDSQSSLRIVTNANDSTGNRMRTQSSGSFTPVSPIDNNNNNSSPPLNQTGGARFDGGNHSSGEGATNQNAVAAISNDMIVRFEIFIVKMPLLPGFHGIQFRRISGNAYLTLGTLSLSKSLFRRFGVARTVLILELCDVQ